MSIGNNITVIAEDDSGAGTGGFKGIAVLVLNDSHNGRTGHFINFGCGKFAVGGNGVFFRNIVKIYVRSFGKNAVFGFFVVKMRCFNNRVVGSVFSGNPAVNFHRRKGNYANCKNCSDYSKENLKTFSGRFFLLGAGRTVRTFIFVEIPLIVSVCAVIIGLLGTAIVTVLGAVFSSRRLLFRFLLLAGIPLGIVCVGTSVPGNILICVCGISPAGRSICVAFGGFFRFGGFAYFLCRIFIYFVFDENEFFKTYNITDNSFIIVVKQYICRRNKNTFVFSIFNSSFNGTKARNYNRTY